MSIYVLNPYVQILDYGNVSVVSHGPRAIRLIVARSLANALRLFEGGGLTAAQFADTQIVENDAEADLVVKFFASRYFIVSSPAQERLEIQLQLHLESFAGEPGGGGLVLKEERTPYMTPAIVEARAFAKQTAVLLKPLKIALVGGCVLDFLRDALVVAGLDRGFDVRPSVFHAWGAGAFQQAVREVEPDVVVYQPGHTSLLSPLWGHFHQVDPAERRQRLQTIKDYLSLMIEELSRAAAGRLALVHNVAGLQAPPFGRGDFRQPMNFRECLYAINVHIEGLIRDNPNVMLVDEELIGARAGYRHLFDDLHFPYGHHGGMFDVTSEEPNQLPELSRLFSREYLACHQAWSGIDRIKCVVCDLDNTLWPGIAAEQGFAWIGSDKSSTWIALGVHEALRVLKSRGILLATASKNSEEQTLREWAAAAANEPRILHPDEFVLHRINWERKSLSIGQIAETIGIGLDSVLFLDDNPVERAEVRQRLPTLNVFDGDMPDLRRFLLTCPRLEVNLLSDEARRRSEMIKAQIRRDEAQASAPDEREFLRGLEIRLVIRRETDRQSFPRVLELIQRTNQFNTTLLRLESGALGNYLDDSHGDLFTLCVSDRFTDYGLVGVILVSAREVDVFVMSCRVLALQVAVPFLGESLRLSGRNLAGFAGRIVVGPRNEPCRALFSAAGFAARGEGLFCLESESHLQRLDREIYQLEGQRSSAA